MRDFARSRFVAPQRSDMPAVTQDGDAIGQPKDLVHLVRDVEDRDAVGSQSPDDLEQPFGLRFGERAGWLIHDEDAGSFRESLRDLDQLLIADA